MSAVDALFKNSHLQLIAGNYIEDATLTVAYVLDSIRHLAYDHGVSVDDVLVVIDLLVDHWERNHTWPR